VITAIDTCVLLDVFGADPAFGQQSADALSKCLSQGGVIACDAVWAETAASFSNSGDALSAMELLRVSFSPIDTAVSLAVGEAWRAYRRAGGSRERVVADFMIGAHALASADRLLTRDRGFYRRYFKGLEVLDPTDT
jgi:predicted nucleic acid-binding protein